MPPMKVTLLGGGGGVGSSTAFNLALRRRADEIVLVDSRPEMVTSHTMDLEQVLEQCPGATVRGGEVDDIHGSDVVVLLSATPLTVDPSRREYLARPSAGRSGAISEPRLSVGCASTSSTWSISCTAWTPRASRGVLR